MQDTMVGGEMTAEGKNKNEGLGKLNEGKEKGLRKKNVVPLKTYLGTPEPPELLGTPGPLSH